MPNQDGTGPEGKGPKSGRGLGGCSDKDMKKFKDMGYYKDTPKRPMNGRGRGRGRGFGNFNRGR